MTLDTQIALALKAPDTFDKVHKNIMNITNDFAIGFAEWLNEEYSYYHGDGEYYDHVENKWYKLKELLEIYKKEKGL